MEDLEKRRKFNFFLDIDILLGYTCLMKGYIMKEEITQKELMQYATMVADRRILNEDIEVFREDLMEKVYGKKLPVEDGLLRIVPKAGKRRPPWKQYVERLKGIGYIKNVISHTQPGPPTIEVR